MLRWDSFNDRNIQGIWAFLKGCVLDLSAVYIIHQHLVTKLLGGQQHHILTAVIKKL